MVMGHSQQRGPCRLRLREQQIKDQLLVFGVEVACRLIRQKQLRLGDERAADGDALLLPLAECAGVSVKLFVQTAGGGEVFGTRAGLRIKLGTGCDAEWIEDVLPRGQIIQKGEILHTAESMFHDHAPANKFGLANCWIYRRHDQEGFGATMNPGDMPTTDFTFNSMADMVKAHQEELSN